MVMIRTLFVAIFLTLFRGRRWLISKLTQELSVRNFDFTATFSGRVALLLIAREMRSSASGTTAAIPDYVCNIVPKALVEAGWRILEYSTDDHLEPDESDIDHLIEDEDVGLLVTASVFGSSALLDYLSRNDVREKILGNNVSCIVDLCQIIALRDKLPDGYGHRMAAILSFNDKSTPGLMGGGVLWTRPLTQNQIRMGLPNQLRLLGRLLLKLAYFGACFLAPSSPPVTKKGRGLRGELQWMLASRQRRPLDYSYCASFPNELIPYMPSRLQLAFALAGLTTDSIRRKKRLPSDSSTVLQTKYVGESPYFVIQSPHRVLNARFPGRRQKPSYAMEGSPNESKKPELLVVHNKGFCDR
jgi:hypothetical protein